MYFDPCQTLRIFFDETTIGADKEGAYSTDNVIPDVDFQSKSTFEATEDFHSIRPKLKND